MEHLGRSAGVLLSLWLTLPACSSDEGASGGSGGTVSGGGPSSGGDSAGSGGAGGADSCPVLGDSLPPGFTELVPQPNTFTPLSVIGAAEGQLYYVDPWNKVMRVPIAGGAPTELGTVKGAPNLRSPDLLLWWEWEGEGIGAKLVSAPLSDLSTTKVVVSGSSVTEIEADATHAYYGTRNPANLYRVALSGEAPAEMLVPDGVTLGAVLNGGFLYWTDEVTSRLERVPRAGGPREKLSEVFLGGPMVGDDDAVYWGDHMKGLEKWSERTGRVSLAEGDPERLALSDGVLYWLDQHDRFRGGFASVRSIKVDGTDPRWLLCGFGQLPPGEIVVEGPYVIFSVDGHGIVRLER